MTGKNNQTIPVVFPLTGKSRFSAFKKFSPVSRETFCKLSNEGKAPQPERLGSRYLSMTTKSFTTGCQTRPIIK